MPVSEVLPWLALDLLNVHHHGLKGQQFGNMLLVAIRMGQRRPQIVQYFVSCARSANDPSTGA
jgi:hypothetical protein